MMHILVIDDENLARQRLIRLLNDIEGCEVIGEAASGDEALAAIELLDPDLLFLDISMPGKDGMATAREISEMSEPPAIIFCTAYDEYALQAFEVEAVGYIVKPVQKEQLAQALEKAKKLNKVQRSQLENGKPELGSARQNITAKSRKGVELIPLEDVYCFVADQKYVTVVHKNGETLIDETLKELETEFAEVFARVHRNALVSKQHILGIEKDKTGRYEIKLKDSEFRPMVSRRHLTEIKTLLTTL
ncbi:Transcriptional regulatory protein YehT [Thalassocella blandensis]|nr:Transcriptional regulatory protein YehT [Thalassocella blandensis]